MSENQELAFKVLGFILVVLLSVLTVLTIQGVYVLENIRDTLYNQTSIVQDMANSNWIMACDDISAQATPLTFIHCNQ